MQLWQKAERKLPEVRHFSLIVQGWKIKSIFFRKVVSSSKCSYRQVECSFDKSTENMSTGNRCFCSMSGKGKKSIFFQKVCFLKKSLWTRRMQFWKTCRAKKMTKDWYSLTQTSKMIEKHFLQKNYFLRRIFWKHRMQFWYLFRNNFARRPISFSWMSKNEKRQKFIRIKTSSRNFSRRKNCSFDNPA